jgi:hypothetical protein
VAADYKALDLHLVDFTKDGEAHYAFHPKGLPPANTLLPLSEFGSDSKLLHSAQRRYSQITHHSAWIRHWRLCSRTSLREAVRFTAVSQNQAGAFLNAVPMHKQFRVPTWAMRIQVQRRLGLPITAAAGRQTSSRGKQLDPHGDMAQNDGRGSHTGRHTQALKMVVDIARSVWGAASVEMEPEDYMSYSNTYRPDMVARMQGSEGMNYIGDVKIACPHASDPTKTDSRGSMIGFGNTEPKLVTKMFGQKQRGKSGDGNFDPANGSGFVRPKVADYAHAIATHQDVQMLLFETYGGFGRGTMRLLTKLKNEVANDLSTHQYDMASWSTRNWMSYQCQRLSVALHIAVAREIGYELGLPAASGTDPRAGCLPGDSGGA